MKKTSPRRHNQLLWPTLPWGATPFSSPHYPRALLPAQAHITLERYSLLGPTLLCGATPGKCKRMNYPNGAPIILSGKPCYRDSEGTMVRRRKQHSVTPKFNCVPKYKYFITALYKYLFSISIDTAISRCMKFTKLAKVIAKRRMEIHNK